MRLIYLEPTQKDWEQFFNQGQSGHGFLGFQGQKYQRGHGIGNFFGGLLRTLLPVFKSAGKSIGKQALMTGARVVSDMADGGNLKESIQRHGKDSIVNLTQKGLHALTASNRKRLRKRVTRKRAMQTGGSIGKRPRKREAQGRIGGATHKTIPRKRKRKQDQMGVYYM